LTLQIKKQGAHRVEVRPDFVMVGDDKIIGSTKWLGADGRRMNAFRS